MKHYLIYEDMIEMLEAELSDNHPNIAFDKDKYAAGYHNGLTMAKAIAMKLKEQAIYCYDCKFYKNGACIRKVKMGGRHAVDRATPNFFCAAGKKREKNS